MISSSRRGFTLIEMVLVIVIIGILVTIAVGKMNRTVETATYEQTKKELDQLAQAIAGNRELHTNGAGASFGYVGDVGALPPDLDALVQNPGGYATWDGPYIDRGFNTDDFKKDGWGTFYTYTDTLIRSTGSGSNIDKLFAESSADLLSNGVMGNVVDPDMTMPGEIYKDSLLIQMIYPDGAGSMTTATINPDSHGSFSFGNIPIGNQTLSIIYIPDSDTVLFDIAVYPDRDVKLNIVFPADLWP